MNMKRIIQRIGIIVVVGIASAYTASALVVGQPAARAPFQTPISVSATVDQTSVSPGATVTYTVSVTNTGSVDLNALTITDTLPAHFTVLTTGQSTFTYTFTEPLPVGKTVAATYPVRVDPKQTAGSFRDSIAVSAGNTVLANASATVAVTVPAAKKEAVAPATPQPTGTVLGVSTDELAATGVGQLDVFIALFGATLVAMGLLGLLHTRTA